MAATVVTDEMRIRAGLRFLRRVDVQINKALKALDEIFESGVTGNALSSFGFSVPDGAGGFKQFVGKMTQAQYNVLTATGNLAGLKQFADAVDNLLTTLDNASGAAANNLNKSLTIGTQLLFPPLGTCTYDDNQTAHCSEAACEDGLLGTWVEG